MTLRGAIVDLDGTVYRGGELLDGTREGIDAMQAAGLNLFFLSNNPIKNGEQYVQRLREMGLDVAAGAASSAGAVTTEYLIEYHSTDEIFLIGHEGLRDQFLAADLPVTDDPAAADVIVASWTPEFDFADMQDALDASDGDIVFYGTDPDRTFPLEKESLVPGSGAIIGSVAAAMGMEPEKILGKPSDVALQAALDRLQVDPSECLIVGDRLDTDLRMGTNAGMTTVLVLTGVSDREDIADSDVSPDYVIEHLGEIQTVLDQG
jgi:HAD superfamily hydrolase (TIGR01450 family)